MKKMIELAEKATGDNKDALSAFASYQALKDALAKRKQLEQTTITEEWLKEHGFARIKSEYDLVPYYQRGKYESDGIIMVWINEESAIHIRYRPLINGGHDYTDLRDVLIPYKSLADLYDACELCGIEL